MAILLALAIPSFKVFLGAHLLLGLAAAFLLGPARLRIALLAVALPCALATLALVLGRGGETVDVSLAPLDLVRTTRESLGLLPVQGVRLLLWSALWVLASLGLRLVGIPAALRSMRQGPLAASVLGAMALFAWPLGLLLRVSAPDVLPGQKPVNDAAFLVEQGGALLWIFAAAAIARWSRGRARTLLAALAVTLLALPSTAQFVAKKARLVPDPIPAAMVRAMVDLAGVSEPGDVVLQRPGARFPPVPVILIGRRVPYERFTPYLTQFARREDLLARHEVVYRFFRTDDAPEAMAIAASLSARWLCLYGGDRVRFETAGLLQPVHEEPGARCYRLLAQSPPPSS